MDTQLQQRLNTYQADSLALTRYPEKRKGAIIYLGLVGEVSEVVDAFLSWSADDQLQELGDVLWYVASICDEHDVKMGELPMHAECPPGWSTIVMASRLVVHAGRVAEAAKKALRDDAGVFSAERRELVIRELGAVVAYVDRLATTIGATLSDVIASNMAKLRQRAPTMNVAFGSDQMPRNCHASIVTSSELRVNSFGTCKICGYYGPGPAHDCRPIDAQTRSVLDAAALIGERLSFDGKRFEP